MSNGGRKYAISTTGFVYGSRLVAAATQAIALVVLARNVTPALLGTVTISVSIVGIIGMLADSGLEAGASRSTARGEHSRASQMVTYHVLLLFTASLTVALAVGILHKFDPKTVPVELFILAPWVFAERRNSLSISFAVANQRAVHASFSLAISRIVTLTLLIVVVNASLFSPVTAYFMFLLTSALLSSLLAPRLPRFQNLRTRVFTLRAALREARPFWIASLSGQARTFDIVVVGALAGVSAAGVYAFPARAVGPMRLIATSLGVVAMPSAARNDLQRVAALERGMWLLTAAFVVLILGFWFVGDNLLTSLLGAGYEEAASILSVLMLGVVFNIPGALWSSVLQGAGRAHLVAKIGLILIPIFYVLLLFGIIWHGSIGAAWGVTVTYFVQFLIMLFIRRRSRWPNN